MSLGFGAIGQFAIGEAQQGLTAETINADKWFDWLSEPVKFKAILIVPNQAAFFFNPIPIVGFGTATGWFSWLTEPKRFPKGLAVQLQSDYTQHPRVIPRSNITLTLNTLENKDQVNIAINVIQSKPPATANVSITEIGTGLSATSVIEQGH